MKGPTGPLFKWFGSKWLSSKKLPPPMYSNIVEPFAGGAGYSLRYASSQITLVECNPYLRALWAWIIGPATSADVLSIPINIPQGTDIRALGMSYGASLLLKHWQRTNNVGECWTVSPWGNSPGQWTENTRARVAEEIHHVKHWQMWPEPDGLQCMRALCLAQATWFLDPPYVGNYRYRAPALDYGILRRHVDALRGHVIVCEGPFAAWLPFTPWERRVTSRRKAHENHHAQEFLYVRGPS